MGYTHYWSFNFRAIPKGKAMEYEKKYQQAILQCQQLIYDYNDQFEHGDYERLSGYSAHTEPGIYQGLEVNGARDGAHEMFCMREHLKQNDTNNFCKTARKPYDLVVTACLCILKAYLGDVLQVSSDGYRDEWNDGYRLAKKYAYSIIPNNIRMR